MFVDAYKRIRRYNKCFDLSVAAEAVLQRSKNEKIEASERLSGFCSSFLSRASVVAA
jgi:hypothetical protein